jgi:hypothetical protein
MNEETWTRIHILINEWLQYERTPRIEFVFLGVCQKTEDCLRPEWHDGECWPKEVEP